MEHTSGVWGLRALPVPKHAHASAAEAAEWGSVLLSKQQPSSEHPPGVAIVHPASCSAREAEAWGAALQAKEAFTCAVCIGSNSVGYALRDEQGQELVRTYHDTLLAKNVERGLDFDQDGFQSTYAAVKCCAEDIRQRSRGTVHVHVVGTAAFRPAGNVSKEAEAALQQMCAPLMGFGNLDARVLTATEEGSLAFNAATADVACQPCVVIDLGGQSTEIAAGYPRSTPPHILSLPIGCLASESIAGMQGHLKLHLLQAQQFISSQLFAPGRFQVILCGGTATSAVALLKGMTHYDGAAVHGSVLSVQDLLCLAGQLELGRDGAGLRSIIDSDEVCAFATSWLSEGRRRSLPAGCAALAEILQCMGTASAIVSNKDILDAIILQ